MNDKINPNDLESLFDDDDNQGQTHVPESTQVIAHRQNMIEKYQRMGIKLAGDPRVIVESGASVPPSKTDLHSRIQRIKSGANRQAVKQITNAIDGANVPSPPPIHMPKKKNQKSNQPQAQTNAPKVESFKAPQTSELRQVEAMFDDDATSYYGSDYTNITMDSDSMGIPDLTSEFRARMQSKYGIQEPQAPIREQKVQASNVNHEELAALMESVSRRVSADMMKTVLKELSSVFSDMQKKNQNVFEIYNKEKKIIKIGNQLYQLTPVKIKNRS